MTAAELTTRMSAVELLEHIADMQIIAQDRNEALKDRGR